MDSQPILVRIAVDADIPELAKLRAQDWETESFWQPRVAAYLHGAHSPREVDAGDPSADHPRAPHLRRAQARLPALPGGGPLPLAGQDARRA